MAWLLPAGLFALIVCRLIRAARRGAVVRRHPAGRVRTQPRSPDMLAQQLLNGLVVGGVYALFALGFLLFSGGTALQPDPTGLFQSPIKDACKLVKLCLLRLEHSRVSSAPK